MVKFVQCHIRNSTIIVGSLIYGISSISRYTGTKLNIITCVMSVLLDACVTWTLPRKDKDTLLLSHPWSRSLVPSDVSV